MNKIASILLLTIPSLFYSQSAYEDWYHASRHAGKKEFKEAERLLESSISKIEYANNRSGLLASFLFHFFPSTADLSVEALATLYEERATCLNNLGRHAEAVSCYKQSISLSKTNEKSYVNSSIGLASIQNFMGAFDESRVTLTEFSKSSPAISVVFVTPKSVTLMPSIPGFGCNELDMFWFKDRVKEILKIDNQNVEPKFFKTPAGLLHAKWEIPCNRFTKYRFWVCGGNSALFPCKLVLLNTKCPWVHIWHEAYEMMLEGKSGLESLQRAEKMLELTFTRSVSNKTSSSLLAKAAISSELWFAYEYAQQPKESLKVKKQILNESKEIEQSHNSLFPRMLILGHKSNAILRGGNIFHDTVIKNILSATKEQNFFTPKIFEEENHIWISSVSPYVTSTLLSFLESKIPTGDFILSISGNILVRNKKLKDIKPLLVDLRDLYHSSHPTINFPSILSYGDGVDLFSCLADI